MNQNQNQNQRYEARVGFTGYSGSPYWHVINGIKPIKALPGYECRMAFRINGIQVLLGET